ncbi:hypothetical protein ACIOD2_40190 [Amycolatopsis sp. NPDC088138]|uniref:hypothetical protein n=1 Tax=Amycolatopsis sp. NPDC088138 TaxID=3363938 RepID=UPI0037F683C1
MLKKVLVALGGVVMAAVGLAPAASAEVEAAPNCQYGTSSYGTWVTSKALTVIGGGSASVGTIQLCRDSSYNYFGFVIFPAKLPVNEWGQAYVYRFRDGVLDATLSCDSSGGNGNVRPAQTRCWTARSAGLSGHYTFQAEGQLWNSHSGQIVASGTTGRTR